MKNGHVGNFGLISKISLFLYTTLLCTINCIIKCTVKSFQELCESLDKVEMVALLANVARLSPTLFDILTPKQMQPADTPSTNNSIIYGAGNIVNDTQTIATDPIASWCICGLCRDMKKEGERICCPNFEKNHEHLSFENHILAEHNLELAMKKMQTFSIIPLTLQEMHHGDTQPIASI